MGLKPTCKEVHQLVSEEFDRPLSLIERVRVHLHILVCGACRNFDGQMRLIRKAMRKLTVPDASEEKSDLK